MRSGYGRLNGSDRGRVARAAETDERVVVARRVAHAVGRAQVRRPRRARSRRGSSARGRRAGPAGRGRCRSGSSFASYESAHHSATLPARSKQAERVRRERADGRRDTRSRRRSPRSPRWRGCDAPERLVGHVRLPRAVDERHGRVAPRVAASPERRRVPRTPTRPRSAAARRSTRSRRDASYQLTWTTGWRRRLVEARRCASSRPACCDEACGRRRRGSSRRTRPSCGSPSPRRRRENSVDRDLGPAEPTRPSSARRGARGFSSAWQSRVALDAAHLERAGRDHERVAVPRAGCAALPSRRRGASGFPRRAARRARSGSR